MKRALIFVLVLFAALGTFLYSTNSDFKEELNNWIGIAKQDSVQGNLQSDSVSNTTSSTKISSKRKKIPKTLKPDEFYSLDEYARKAPKKYEVDITTLAQYLIKPANTDIEKARVLFTWVASHINYDDIAFNSNNYPDYTTEYVLQNKRAVCEGYSNILKSLCEAAGLDAEKVSGYAKGYGYAVGDKFTDTDHSWNAIKIDNTWRLFDATWANGFGTNKNGKLVSTIKFDPYWFDVPPDEFIFSHLPEDNNWQLTNPTITMTQYEKLPFLNDSFFKMGFDSKEIFKKSISGEITEFVETFPFDYPVKAIELPITKKITRSKEYTFSFESEYLENVALSDGGLWIYLKKKGNVFTINYAPVSNKIQIAAKANWYDNFSTIATYETVDEKNLTAHNTVFK